MSSIVRFFPAILLLLIVAFYGGGRLLPSDYTISSELRIDASPPSVFRWTATASGWQRWFTGPEGDVDVESDSKLTLVVEDVRHVLELTETSSPTAVRYRHYADAPGALEPVKGQLTIEASGSDASNVRIVEDIQVASSTQRWLVYLFGRDLMVQVLDRELHNLKSLVETGRVEHQGSGARRRPEPESTDDASRG